MYGNHLKNLHAPTPRHILIKISQGKDKERILKAAKEKPSVVYLSADFSAEILQDKRGKG